jgi:amino acid permease
MFIMTQSQWERGFILSVIFFLVHILYVMCVGMDGVRQFGETMFTFGLILSFSLVVFLVCIGSKPSKD